MTAPMPEKLEKERHSTSGKRSEIIQKTLALTLEDLKGERGEL